MKPGALRCRKLRAAGITDPLTVRNATCDVVQTGSKAFIESAKAVEEAVNLETANGHEYNS